MTKYTKKEVGAAILALEMYASNQHIFTLKDDLYYVDGKTKRIDDLTVNAWCGVNHASLRPGISFSNEDDRLVDALEAAALLREGLIPECDDDLNWEWSEQ